ncbi:MAG: hypothetical protein HND44_06170 [Chloroflexi bacterium]|nr:hypothetical protein [Ardenticatenaceae bacterium]MBL1128076.1 hypothetical protein [Chloroflexota bacterium]NOG34147.1 hypothetical protein [Chloroflexota bacterium]GIK56854.1 MAG: hypothetical protein BroJett015_25170 [Chloroflexota bacterium]
MVIEDLLASARYVVDETGERTAVQLDLPVWENIITLLAQTKSDENGNDDAAWDTFMKTLAESVVDTGIPDLAAEHDHYLYGSPKRQTA